MVKLIFDPDLLNISEKTVYEEMIAKRKKQGAPFGAPYQVLMNHPELCQKIEALGFYLKFTGHLPRNIYQFVVLAVAKETQCSFEWTDHIQHAQEAGVPKEIIDKLNNDGLVTAAFGAPYKLVVELLSYTLKWKNIPGDVQTNIIKVYSIRGLIEIVVLSGFYQMFSAINQGFDIS